MKEKPTVLLQVDTSEVNQTIEKVNELQTKLNEAMDIVESIASLRLDLRINAIINDKSTELARITTE